MNPRSGAKSLLLALRAAGFPPSTRRHAVGRIESALLVYHEGPDGPPSWEAPRRGPPRDYRLEALLIAIAVQFHVAVPDQPGVTKRGERYVGPLADLTQAVLNIGGIRPTTRNLGRLIYSVVRKEAQIHGDLESYPTLTKRSRQNWSLPTDEPIPDHPLELLRHYGARRRRRS